MAVSGQLVRDGVLRLVVASHEGDIKASDLEAHGGHLAALNYTSLSLIRLLDAIENEFGVFLDTEDETISLHSVDTITDAVVAEMRRWS